MGTTYNRLLVGWVRGAQHAPAHPSPHRAKPCATGGWPQGAQHQTHTAQPGLVATARQLHALLNGQHVTKSIWSPLALSQTAFSHDSEKEQKGWKLSDLLKTTTAQH